MLTLPKPLLANHTRRANPACIRSAFLPRQAFYFGGRESHRLRGVRGGFLIGLHFDKFHCQAVELHREELRVDPREAENPF